jgi:DNA-binding XRE family transcriptional regulator
MMLNELTGNFCRCQYPSGNFCRVESVMAFDGLWNHEEGSWNFDAGYTKAAKDAGMTDYQITRRDADAERIWAFQVLINKHPALVTDADIQAAGLNPDQWRDEDANLDEEGDLGDGFAGMNLDALTYNVESDIGSVFLPEDFRAWRNRMGLTQPEAAAKLDINEKTIRNYESGRLPIPRVVAMACWALSISLG